LPSTPLKAAELRADGWRKRWGGLQQTEIDALAALRPRVLAELATQAVAPFHDPSLDRRADHARTAWLQDAGEVLTRSIGPEWLEMARLELQARLEEIVPELERIQRSIEIDPDLVDLPPVPVVEPDLHGLPSAPAPLWSSTDDWTEATLRLAADRTLADERSVT
jgi:hypothetical protein